MNKKIVFFVEEKSMEAFLNIIIPRILPEVTFQVITHQGKTDLRISIPRKLRAWREDVHFFILHDKDANNCVQLKNELKALCEFAGKPETIIRIVCSELESWYLGDLMAVEQAYNINNLSRLQNKEKFRNPDLIPKPSTDLLKLTQFYQKVSGTKAIAEKMNLTINKSKSFNVFIEKLKTYPNF